MSFLEKIRLFVSNPIWNAGTPWQINHITQRSSQFSSVTQSCLTVCVHGDTVFGVTNIQYARLPCPSSTPGSYSNLGPSSLWCHPSHPLSSPSPPAFNLSQHEGLFQWVVSSYHVAKYWNFSFSISPSNEYSGLISFRIHWLDLLAAQGTLENLLQHHSTKASIL